MSSYDLPVDFVFRVVGALIASSKLDFQAESRLLVERISPPIVYSGLENILETGPFIITPNHYSRSGIRAWWIPIAISACISSNISWVMTANWTANHFWQNGWYPIVTRWLFARIADVFTFSRLPSVAKNQNTSDDTDMLVRNFLLSAEKSIKSVDCGKVILGIAPEGRDVPGGVLGWPPQGSGKLFRYLTRLGYLINPVGVYEDYDHLVVQFGERYDLNYLRMSSKKADDKQIRYSIMAHIGACLPLKLRGEFASIDRY
jgi:1-acyl-sn-glycerol-3-phosphate acyltransferase